MTTSVNALLFGFSLGFSLILAIGAQNAFVLKQGLKQQHVFIICLICALSDALLILFGITGFHQLISAYPWVVTIARTGGALFLFVYGTISFYAAFNKKHSLQPSDLKPSSLLNSILTCLAFTWLNPHVYLDTVVLLGSISAQFSGQLVYFTIGATTASFVFFFGLGYGAALLKPLFAKPRSWQILDTIIGCIMWTIALSLVFGA